MPPSLAWETTDEDVFLVLKDTEHPVSIEQAADILGEFTPEQLDEIEGAAMFGCTLEEQTNHAHIALAVVLRQLGYIGH